MLKHLSKCYKLLDQFDSPECNNSVNFTANISTKVQSVWMLFCSIKALIKTLQEINIHTTFTSGNALSSSFRFSSIINKQDRGMVNTLYLWSVIICLFLNYLYSLSSLQTYGHFSPHFSHFLLPSDRLALGVLFCP